MFGLFCSHNYILQSEEIFRWIRIKRQHYVCSRCLHTKSVDIKF
jgi:hypothetical protein